MKTRIKKGSANPRNGSGDNHKSFPVVVIGASAGGIDALSKIVGALDPEFSASVLIVLHTSTYSALPAILGRASYLKVEHARDGQILRPGHLDCSTGPSLGFA